MNHFWGQHSIPSAADPGRNQYNNYPGPAANANGYDYDHCERYNSSAATFCQSKTGWDSVGSSCQSKHYTEADEDPERFTYEPEEEGCEGLPYEPEKEEDPDGLPYEFEENPDGLPYESKEEEDPELKKRRKELQVIEDQIILKKASLALKTVNVKTLKRRHFTEDSKSLKDRVSHILQGRNRACRKDVVTYPSQCVQASSERRFVHVPYDHPLRLRVVAALKRRLIKPPEELLTSEVNKTNEGFLCFLDVLNQGVDMNKLTEMANERRDLMTHRSQNYANTDRANTSVNVPVEVGERSHEHYTFDKTLNKELDNGELTTTVNFKNGAQTDPAKSVDDPQKHLQNILRSLGLSLGTDEISHLGDRTQERLFGKRLNTEEEVNASKDKGQIEQSEQKRERTNSPAHRRSPSCSELTLKSNRSQSRTPRQRRSRSFKSPHKEVRSSKSPHRSRNSHSPYRRSESHSHGRSTVSSKSISMSQLRTRSPLRRQKNRNPRSPSIEGRRSWSPDSSKHSLSSYGRRDSYLPRKRSKSPNLQSTDHQNSHLQHLTPMQDYPYPPWQYPGLHYPPQMNPGTFDSTQYTDYYNYWGYNQAPILGSNNFSDPHYPHSTHSFLPNHPNIPLDKPIYEEQMKTSDDYCNQPIKHNFWEKNPQKPKKKKKTSSDITNCIQIQKQDVREQLLDHWERKLITKMAAVWHLDDTKDDTVNWKTELREVIDFIKRSNFSTGGETTDSNTAQDTNCMQLVPLEYKRRWVITFTMELSDIIEQQPVVKCMEPSKVVSMNVELHKIVTRIQQYSNPNWGKKGSEMKLNPKDPTIPIPRVHIKQKITRMLENKHKLPREEVWDKKPDPLRIPIEEEIKASMKKKLEVFNSRMKNNVRQPPMPQM